MALMDIMQNETGAYLLYTFLYLSNSWVPPTQLNVTFLEEPVNNPLFENQTLVCYGMYGCFSTIEPWIDTRRPVCNKPESPTTINAKFCLLTRYNPSDCQYLDFLNHTTIYQSFYTPGHKTYMVTHGFLEDGGKPWIRNMSRELLTYEDANVIIIDWGFGSVPPYTQAVANTRVVGRVAAMLVYTLTVLTRTSTENFHFIGHSLGAHLGGYVGYTLKHHFNYTIGRITGMDPAEPHFADTQPIVRLDTSDAHFVDIIHTNAKLFISGGLGINAAIGHIDYFPNGGANQPGCGAGMMKFIKDENQSMVVGLRKFFSCDHIRSYEYMSDSINACTFVSVECESWEKFLAGNCFPCKSKNNSNGALCVRQGMPALIDYKNQDLFAQNSLRKLNAFYTITDNEEPYCIRRMVHMYKNELEIPDDNYFSRLFSTLEEKLLCTAFLYRVSLTISNSSTSYAHNGEIGAFSISIIGTNGTTKMLPTSEDKYLPPNSTHVYVVGGTDVGTITSASLYWLHRTSINLVTWRIDPFIHVGHVLLETFTTTQRIRLCPESDEVLASGSTMKIVPC